MDSLYDHSRHDEMMRIFAPSVVPQSSTVVPQSSTSVLFNIHDDINSDNDCDLPDNEDAVDLLKYLDCSEVVICNDLPSSVLTPAQIRQDEPTIPLSQLTPVLHSSEMNNDLMPNVKRETEKPAFNCLIPKRETEEDEFTKGLDLHLYSPSEFDMTDPEIGIDIATGNDSNVDTKSDETAADASFSADMFDAVVPSTSTASTSSSTKAKDKGVCTARWISTPRPRGRPRSSKKKQQSARTAHASTSTISASLPSYSNSETENSTASNPVVLGRKWKLVKDDKTQSQPTYTQVPSTSIAANFHDYALNPTASSYTTETGRPTVMSKRNYRRNTFDAVDREKQNHHNELEHNRRQHFAYLFTGLRDEVLKISCNPKASKISILNKARFHILDLENTNKLQEEEASRLSQNQKLLKIQLQQLQSKISGRVK